MANNNVDGEIKLGVNLTVKDIQKTARDLQKQVSDIFKSSNTDKFDAKTKNIAKTLSKLTTQSKTLADEIDRFANEKIPTDRYKAVQKTIQQIKDEQEQLIEKQRIFIRAGGSENAKLYQVWGTEIKKLDAQLASAEKRALKLEESGQGYTLGKDTQRYRDMTLKLNDTSNAIQVYKTKLDEATQTTKKFGNQSSNTFRGLGTFVSHLLKMSGEAVRRGFSRVINGMRSIFKHSRNIQRSSRVSLKNILAYALGIHGLFALISKLKGALQEGMNNLVRWNDGTNEANKAVSELTSSLLYLKNSLAAAFTPILTVVAPIISKFTDMLAEAINKLGMFFAYMTGKTKYIQAKKVMQDYAKSLGEVNDKLAEYDKLSVINDEDASKDPNNMFEEVAVPISGGIADWVERFRQAWRDADFSEIGRTIGQKLKEALDSIPWEQIKETAGKVGKSLATFINGFVEVEGLGESIGETIAEALNTALTFAYEFVSNLHWDSIGKFISDAIMGFFNTFDWDLFTSTIAGFINGMVDLLTTVLTETNWDEIGNKIGQCFTDLIEKIDWRNIGKLAAEGINAFFELVGGISETFKASDLGDKLASMINEAIKDIKWDQNSQGFSDLITALIDCLASFVEKTEWKALGDSIVTAITNIKWKDIFESATTLAINLFQALIDLLSGFLDNDPDEFLQVGQDIVDGIQSAIEKANLENLGKSLFHLLLRAIYWVLPAWARDLVDAFRKTWEEIRKRWFGSGNESGDIQETGKGIIDELKKGIKKALWDWSPWWFRIVVTKITDTLEEQFGIQHSSPSTLMEAAGKLIMDGLRNGFEGGVPSIVDIFERLKPLIDQPLNNILASVESFVNGIIDGINTAIDCLNSFRITPPDWLNSAISAMGGTAYVGDFSFNLGRLNHVQLPRLAQGAVIPPNRQFLAMLGDQKSGTNIEAPLETMVTAFKQALAEDGGAGNRGPIVLQLDGRTVAQVVWDETDKKYKQTGQYIPRYT